MILKKKPILFFIIFCMIFALTANVFAATTLQSIQPNYVSTDPPTPGFTGYALVTAQPCLNVRGGPGLDFPISGTLPYDSYVYVVMVITNGWAEIRMTDGSYGYVLADYLEV